MILLEIYDQIKGEFIDELRLTLITSEKYPEIGDFSDSFESLEEEDY